MSWETIVVKLGMYINSSKGRIMHTKEPKKCLRNRIRNTNCPYDKKVKGTQLQIDDLVLVKRVAWKGRHKIQNKWEPEEYIIVEQPNKSVPVYKGKPVGNGKESAPQEYAASFGHQICSRK